MKHIIYQKHGRRGWRRRRREFSKTFLVFDSFCQKGSIKNIFRIDYFLFK
jgi:hypothetical protein